MAAEQLKIMEENSEEGEVKQPQECQQPEQAQPPLQEQESIQQQIPMGLDKEEQPQEEQGLGSSHLEYARRVELQHNMAQSVMQPSPKSECGFSSEVSRRLSQIFQFYCKNNSTSALKESLTFDKVLHKYEVLTMNKWMLCCRDFGLLGILSAAPLHDIFKTHSQHQELGFAAFNSAFSEVLAKCYPDFQSGLAAVQLASEEGWKVKCLSLGIPYFEKPHSQRVLTRPDPKAKSRSKLAKDVPQPASVKPLASRPLVPMRKRQLKMDFEEVSQMRMKIDIPIEREEEDDIYLREYKLTNREEAPSTQSGNKNNPLKNKSNQCHIAEEFTGAKQRKRSIDRTQRAPGNENAVGQSNSGILKRLDEKINRFRKR